MLAPARPSAAADIDGFVAVTVTANFTLDVTVNMTGITAAQFATGIQQAFIRQLSTVLGLDGSTAEISIVSVVDVTAGARRAAQRLLQGGNANTPSGSSSSSSSVVTVTIGIKGLGTNPTVVKNVRDTIQALADTQANNRFSLTRATGTGTSYTSLMSTSGLEIGSTSVGTPSVGATVTIQVAAPQTALDSVSARLAGTDGSSGVGLLDTLSSTLGLPPSSVGAVQTVISLPALSPPPSGAQPPPPVSNQTSAADSGLTRVEVIVLAVCVSFGVAIIFMVVLVCVLYNRSKENRLIPGYYGAVGESVANPAAAPLSPAVPAPAAVSEEMSNSPGCDRVLLSPRRVENLMAFYAKSVNDAEEGSMAGCGDGEDEDGAMGLVQSTRVRSCTLAGPSSSSPNGISMSMSPSGGSFRRVGTSLDGGGEIPKRRGSSVAVAEHALGAAPLTRGDQLRRLAWEASREPLDLAGPLAEVAAKLGLSVDAVRMKRREALMRVAWSASGTEGAPPPLFGQEEAGSEPQDETDEWLQTLRSIESKDFSSSTEVGTPTGEDVSRKHGVRKETVSITICEEEEE